MFHAQASSRDEASEDADVESSDFGCGVMRVEATSGTTTALEAFRGAPFEQRRTGMPKDAHNKAAERHENAAKSHRTAAEHHAKGDHAKGREELAKAHGHSKTAHEHSETADGKSQAQK